MLVLTRSKNEKIIVDETITFTIVEIRNGKIRVGIDAPEGIRIRREEIPAEEFRRKGGKPCKPKS